MLNIYIHIPFCSRKCDYCAFYSQTRYDIETQEKFLDKLELDLQKFNDKNLVTTIYIGGGTPTILSLNSLNRLFNILSKNLNISEDCEISMEANPETLSVEKVAFLEEKINRISLGVQSFNKKFRNILGRHSEDKAIYQAINLIQNSRIKNFNIDLIYAINSQTLEDFKSDLSIAKKTGITHLSAYNLTIEEQTKLAQKKIVIDEDLAFKMYTVIENYFPRYEISNYATKEYQCKHNCNVWQGQKLYGFGPAAASFDGENRFMEIANFREWLNDTPVEMDIITKEERAREIFVVNLRTINGWSRDRWERTNIISWQNLIDMCQELSKNYPNCFNINANAISLTETGLLFWNEIAENFL